MRITKRPSLSKITEQKMSMTMTEKLGKKQDKLSNAQQKQYFSKLPPIRKKLRNISTKILEPEPRKQTETTLSESIMMFQSMYGGQEWLKPSDYVKEIGELNLLGQQKVEEVKTYSINLTDKFQKNIEKSSRLREVTEKWVQVLKKAMSYPTSKKAASDKLLEQIKFWKILSRKFDELQYQFNDQRATTLLNIMKNVMKIEPLHRSLLEQFLFLKEEVIRLTPSIKKLHLQLEEVVSGFVVKLQQCSDICQSIHLLKKILIGFEAIGEENNLLKNRYCVIYEKIDQCMTQKLLATSIYPRQLANISSVKQNYQIIDQGLSFYSHFINSLETNQQNQKQLIQRAEYTRQVIANLLQVCHKAIQILSYFQFLFNARQVNQFSKLFSHKFDYNIYNQQNSDSWNSYMQLVNNSMELHNFEP